MTKVHMMNGGLTLCGIKSDKPGYLVTHEIENVTCWRCQSSIVKRMTSWELDKSLMEMIRELKSWF